MEKRYAYLVPVAVVIVVLVVFASLHISENGKGSVPTGSQIPTATNTYTQTVTGATTATQQNNTRQTNMTAASNQCKLSGSESTSITYTLYPFSQAAVGRQPINNTYFYVPYGSKASVDLTVQGSTPVLAVIVANITGSTPPTVVSYTPNLTSNYTYTNSSLGPGVYQVAVEDSGNTSVQVGEKLYVSYSPNAAPLCTWVWGQSLRLVVYPPGSNPNLTVSWIFYFFVPQGGVGDLNATYYSNTTVQVSLFPLSGGLGRSSIGVSGTLDEKGLKPGVYEFSVLDASNSPASLRIDLYASYTVSGG